MEVRLADASFKESDRSAQHLFVYVGPESLQWLVTSEGESRFLGAKPWSGAGKVEAVHSLIQEEEAFGFAYTSVHIMLSASRLNLVPKDLYRAGEGMDYFSITDELGIDEELQRSEATSLPYEFLFPINRGYLLAWKIAFPQAKISLLHEVLAEKMIAGTSLWVEDNRAHIMHFHDGILQNMQVKPLFSQADLDYQIGLLIQAFPSINLNDIQFYLCGSTHTSNLFSALPQQINWKILAGQIRFSPAHIKYFSEGQFQALALLTCE